MTELTYCFSVVKKNSINDGKKQACSDAQTFHSLQEFGFKLSDLDPHQASNPEQYDVSCIDEMPVDEHLEQMQQEVTSPGHQSVEPVGFEKVCCSVA